MSLYMDLYEHEYLLQNNEKYKNYEIMLNNPLILLRYLTQVNRFLPKKEMVYGKAIKKPHNNVRHFLLN